MSTCVGIQLKTYIKGTKLTYVTVNVMSFFNKTEPIGQCEEDEFTCSDGWCIDYKYKCDNDENSDGPGCYSRSDEEFCGKHTYNSSRKDFFLASHPVGKAMIIKIIH